jgi:uncharacterized membrane protein YkoI
MTKLSFSCRSALLGLAALVVAGGSAHADDDVDHEVARQLLTQGKIRPLAEVIDAVKLRVPGDVIKVELEREDGAYVYELKILRPNGRVQEVEADAATAKIREIEDDD